VSTTADPTAGPAPAFHEDTTGWLLARAAHLVSGRLAGCLQPLGVTVRSFAVLSAACRGEPMTQGCLGELLAIDKSTLVVTLDELERLGLVRRIPDPGDRRVRRVASTEAGVDLVNRATDAIVQTESCTLGVLDLEERKQLAALLRRLIASPGAVAPAAGSCV